MFVTISDSSFLPDLVASFHRLGAIVSELGHDTLAVRLPDLSETQSQREVRICLTVWGSRHPFLTASASAAA